jgi:hypothetical protein
MMKEVYAKQLGSQLGKFIKMDASFPGYMRVCVDYPLHKALVPELKVKVKGRGIMQIVVMYENVPFFDFMSSRMGHAALNCDQGDMEEQMVRYGEELQASPPWRTRVILLKQQDSKAVKSLFQAITKEGIAVGVGLARPRWVAEQERKEKVADSGELAGGKWDVDVMGRTRPKGV